MVESMNAGNVAAMTQNRLSAIAPWSAAAGSSSSSSGKPARNRTAKMIGTTANAPIVRSRTTLRASVRRTIRSAASTRQPPRART